MFKFEQWTWKELSKNVVSAKKNQIHKKWYILKLFLVLALFVITENIANYSEQTANEQGSFVISYSSQTKKYTLD